MGIDNKPLSDSDIRTEYTGEPGAGDTEQNPEEVEFPPFDFALGNSNESPLLTHHKEWLSTIRHEHPNPKVCYRVAVYIRYFNQTKYKNYLDYHKQEFLKTIEQYPNWEFVGFYIDEGSAAPNMETAAAWAELLSDCDDGKVDLIITQKVSNVSKKMHEVIFCARILAARTPPVGIYFISEDLYTLASYYQEDLRDTYFLPHPDWKLLPDDALDVRGAIHD